MKIVEKDQYTKEDLDEALEMVMCGIEVINNKELFKLVKEHAKDKGEKMRAIKEFNINDHDGKISSIEDLRKKKYSMFKAKS